MAAATIPSVQIELLTQMSALRAARNTRYELAEGQINRVKWYFAYFIDIVALFTVGFGHLHARRRAQIVAFLLFFTVSTPTMVPLYTQSNPYAGFNPVIPRPIELALERSTAMLKNSPAWCDAPN